MFLPAYIYSRWNGNDVSSKREMSLKIYEIIIKKTKKKPIKLRLNHEDRLVVYSREKRLTRCDRTKEKKRRRREKKREGKRCATAC